MAECAVVKPEYSADMRLVLDERYLNMNTLGNVDLRAQVLELFLRQSSDLVDLLETSVSDVNIVEYAHTLKGSCFAVGAFKLGQAASELEQAADRGEPDLAPFFANVRAALAETRGPVTSLMRQQA